MLYCGRNYVSEGTDVDRQANQKNVIFVNIYIFIYFAIFFNHMHAIDAMIDFLMVSRNHSDIVVLNSSLNYNIHPMRHF